MQSEINSLRQQIATLQIELALKEQIQKMQSEIDLLKWRINEITSVDSVSTSTSTNDNYIIDNTNWRLSTIYPDYIQFVVNYISSWPEYKIDKVNSIGLYQEYLTWYETNNKKALSNNILGKKFALIDIERKRAGNRKRE
ncbi:37235_t:CDS:1 [Gigaspora margarita]|uniref:37235_t:CDS:1 n=1 Tax=Gigaspora margarita TaxID=4874 RepID=A0ABN7UMI6_GIGMA|nr:37235_t:CDS:1 [Gigaspora margarita]